MDETMGRIINIYIALGTTFIKLKALQVQNKLCQCYMYIVYIVFMLMCSCMFLDRFW